MLFLFYCLSFPFKFLNNCVSITFILFYFFILRILFYFIFIYLFIYFFFGDIARGGALMIPVDRIAPFWTLWGPGRLHNRSDLSTEALLNRSL